MPVVLVCKVPDMGKKPRKTHIENISIFGLSAHTGPLYLQMYAADFLSAAKSVQPPHVEFAPARSSLACHAIELALKAFLSLKGLYSLKELDELFSHRLVNILDEAERNGLYEFVNLKDVEKFHIRIASDYYSSKIFDYPAAGEALQGYPTRPNINIIIDAAETLVGALKEPCRDHR
jgi:hypothetical protein